MKFGETLIIDHRRIT